MKLVTYRHLEQCAVGAGAADMLAELGVDGGGVWSLVQKGLLRAFPRAGKGWGSPVAGPPAGRIGVAVF